jgi:hypothetical protein
MKRYWETLCYLAKHPEFLPLTLYLTGFGVFAGVTTDMILRGSETWHSIVNWSVVLVVHLAYRWKRVDRSG